ncbi:MAG: CBS domain-containing protein [Rhodothermales bacterium]|nr:CBS domain-containing protein [Rhodothermales bacterium]MCA0267819.1 CBS domain-containing protein [Bacteroidota bacterium]
MTAPTLAAWMPEPLAPTMTVEEALGRTMDAEDGLLPVVDATGRLLGVVSEAMLLDAESPDAEISTVLRGQPVTIGPDAHTFEATKLLVQHRLAAIPVVDDSGQYLGFARRHDIFERFALMLATQEAGAVVSVEVPPRDYALAQLIHAAEQNGVHVRAVVTEPRESERLEGVDEDGELVAAEPDADAPLRVTLKLDTTDASRVRAMFEHHGYRVVASYGETEDQDDLNDRVRAFMRYLDT